MSSSACVDDAVESGGARAELPERPRRTILVLATRFLTPHLRQSTVFDRRLGATARAAERTEQYIEEGKKLIQWTPLSCRKFRDNAVRLQLHAFAYNLANFIQTLALPRAIAHWSLTRLR